jgi:hypothetical protein
MSSSDIPGFNLSKWEQPISLKLTLGALFLLHGQLSLALRHPLIPSLVAQHTRELLSEIERLMLQYELLTPAALRHIHDEELAAVNKEKL